MPRSLEVHHEREGDTHEVAIRGQLDETVDFSDLAAAIDGPVRIDLAEVSFVNSLGLRAWVRFLLSLSDRDTDVSLVRCSEAMVHQMNMVVAAKAGAHVASFFAPYDCPKCGHAESVCLDVAPNLDTFRAMRLPDQPCPECKTTMECGELSERYLLFLELR